MKRLFPICCVSAILFSMVASSSHAEDAIKQLSNGRTTRGNITNMTPDEVTINYSGVPTKIPVGDIDTLTYEGEPAQFSQARRQMGASQFEDARASLNQISANSIASASLKVELEFLKAYANAQIAIRGGDASLNEAATGLEAFIKANPKNYRIYESVQLLGDLYMQMNQKEKALAQFNKLLNVENPMLRVRGSLGKASVLLDTATEKTSKENAKEAGALYKTVKDLVDSGEVKAQKELLLLSVALGMARCKAITDKAAEAEKEIQRLLPQIPAENVQMNALAYNTLGTALKLQENKTMDAIAAFLHTHLLYSNDPILDRQALNELINLYRNGVNNEGRAVALEKERKDRYGN